MTVQAFDSDDEELESVGVENITVDGDAPDINQVYPEDGDFIDEDDPVIETEFENTLSGLKNASIEFGEQITYLDDEDEGITEEITLELELEDLSQGELLEFDLSAENMAGEVNNETVEFTVDTSFEGPDEFEFSPDPGIIDVEDEDREIEVTVEGTGDERTEKELICLVDGDEEDSDGSTELESGVEETFTCEIPDDFDDQSFDFEAQLEDQAGNSVTSDSQEYSFDASPPTVTSLNTVEDISAFQTDFEVEYTAIDDIAGVEEIEYYIGEDPGDGEANQESADSDTFQVDTSGVDSGENELNLRAKDELGKWGFPESLLFDYYPDEDPELEITGEDDLEITLGETETLDLELSNTGVLLVSSGQIGSSEISDSENYPDIAPDETENIQVSFNPQEDIGPQEVTLDASTVDASHQVSVRVVPDQETQEEIESDVDSSTEQFNDIEEEIEELNSSLSQDRAETLHSDFSEYSDSISILQQELEDEEYHEVEQILEGLDSEREAAQTTLEEVEEEQRVADRNRMIIYIVVGLIAFIGGGVGFLVYNDDYEFEVLGEDKLSGFDLGIEGGWQSTVDDIKFKIWELKESLAGDSENPDYEFK